MTVHTKAISEAPTLFDILHAAPERATAVVLPDLDLRLTYGELLSQVLNMADALAAAGVRRGDRVANVMPAGLPAIVSFLASAMAGTAVPLNPAYREDEFNFFLGDTKTKVLLCPADNAAAARKAAANRIPVLNVEMDQKGCVSIPSINRNGHAADSQQADDVALILHTSGSTGRSKSVPIRHSNLAASVRNIERTYDLSPGDVSLCAMPLFHLHGLVVTMLSTFSTGGAVVLPGAFDAPSFWGAVRDYGVTWYSAVPTFHRLLLAHTDHKGGERPAGAERLRFVRVGSAALPPDLMTSLEDLFGAPVVEGYGMTEAAQICSNPLPPRKRKPGTVGLPVGVDLSIIDTTGKHLASGQRGEVVIQGPNVMSGYDNNPEANAASFMGGWFRTGDYGYVDEDGYLMLTARLKEIISRGGDKIAPMEVDEALLSHPDVAEAAAFGVLHPTLGEEVVAAIVLRNPQKESVILAHCREKIADFKCPKKLYVMTRLPRTATGKIQRGAVASAIKERKN